MLQLDPLVWIAQNEVLAAAVVALLSAGVLYGYLGTEYLGADDDWWEPLRQTILPWVDSHAQEAGLYTQATLPEFHMAATIPRSPETVEESLEEMGAHRNPVSSFKYSHDERAEESSWVFRDLPENFEKYPPLTKMLIAANAKGQLHVILFERPGGYTDVGVHHEDSSINPGEASDHYRGQHKDADRGQREFRERWRAAGFSLREYAPPEKNLAGVGSSLKRH